MNTETFLTNAGMQQYSSLFKENEIEVSDLKSLTNEDLLEIGVSALGHRKKILLAAQQIGETQLVDSNLQSHPKDPKQEGALILASNSESTDEFFKPAISKEMYSEPDPIEPNKIEEFMESKFDWVYGKRGPTLIHPETGNTKKTYSGVAWGAFFWSPLLDLFFREEFGRAIILFLFTFFTGGIGLFGLHFIYPFIINKLMHDAYVKEGYKIYIGN